MDFWLNARTFLPARHLEVTGMVGLTYLNAFDGFSAFADNESALVPGDHHLFRHRPVTTAAVHLCLGSFF